MAYISLLEGGIGGVARAALYKPLADNNIHVISEILAEIKNFFRIVAYIFIIYVIILSCTFKTISHIECMDWFSTFLLVIVISLSTFAQYFVGISYSVLIQAAQRTYIMSLISISTVVLNTIFVIILVDFGSNLTIVKFVSSCVFVLRPFLMCIYVRREFSLVKCNKSNKTYLSQKWSGLGQHIAFFLYSNTDIAILTIFADLRMVAVYSVYYMVVSQIENLIASFSSGMEAVFGDMLVKNEMEELHKTFNYYEIMISVISTILFSVTAVLIVPFVRIYTENVSDTNYIAPTFSLLLILSSYVACLRKPYHNLIIAAGHFKQTQIAAYGEAIINIGLSVVLVIYFGLIGVAIGTLVATTFRLLYYAFYLSTHIFNRRIIFFIRCEIKNTTIFVLVYIIGKMISNLVDLKDYVIWAKCGVIMTLIAILITIIGNFTFYKYDLKVILTKQMINKL